jgi:hypothetical protein
MFASFFIMAFTSLMRESHEATLRFLTGEARARAMFAA